jgi:Fe-S cluster assembly protein SufD
MMSEVLKDPKFGIQNSKSTGILAESWRSEAEQVLGTTDFPTTRMEAWKYTRVAKIKNTNFEIRQVALDTSSIAFPVTEDAVTLVFVNGFFQAGASTPVLPAGLQCQPLSELSEAERAALVSVLPLENEFFNAMNTAYATDGAFVKIAANAVIEKPVQLIHVLTDERAISNVRNFIVAEKFSQAEIVQGFFAVDATDCFANVVTEIHVGENANLTIDKLQYENASCFHIATEEVSQHKDSTFTINTITLNGGFVRNNLHIAVEGQNCETNLNGAYILKDKQHVDNHTIVDHKVAHCVSNELYKGVMNDQSTAVFNGKVFVRKDAQKINAFQSNGNVLLSDNATINSKPELEIYADDVKCSHGSTTGQLDEEAVFYLRARGLSETSARALMVAAFVGDVLEKVEQPEVRSFIDQLLLERYGWEF